jgi:hypothetical protein
MGLVFFLLNNLKAGADLGLCWAVISNFFEIFGQVRAGSSRFLEKYFHTFPFWANFAQLFR